MGKQVRAVESPLVSVVVPFYNVRECVGYCMDSLLAQTFESPYEVVCVDDGSTDGTGKLLDAYADDPRVVVLHKENGGLSDARNHGVERARADLVTFVDGDDVVAPQYLEALYGALTTADAEIAMCGFQEVPAAQVEKFLRRANQPQAESMGRAQAVSEVLYGRPALSTWGRLARRTVYLDHPFPEGKVFEDTLMFRWHFLPFERYARVDAPLYGYVARTGSISKDAHPGEAKVRNHDEAIDSFRAGLAGAPESVRPAATYRTALECCRLYRLAVRVEPRSEYTKSVMADARAYVRAAWPGLRRDPEVGNGDKLRFWVLAHLPWVYNPLMRLYERILKGMS